MRSCPITSVSCSQASSSRMSTNLQPRACSFFSRASTTHASPTRQCQWAREILFPALRPRMFSPAKRSRSLTMDNPNVFAVTRAINSSISSALAKRVFPGPPSTKRVKCDDNCCEDCTTSQWVWIWDKKTLAHRLESLWTLNSERLPKH